MSLDHLAALGRAQQAFAQALAAADPDAPVPSCAPWRVADLALHLGTVHWWAAAMAAGVDLDPTAPTEPRDTDSLVRFYRWAARHLHDTLASLDPNATGVTLDGPGPSSFWRRRQLHETLVHLWDLGGADAMPTEPQLWWDTAAEVVDTMTPRQVRLGRIEPLKDSAELVASDGTLVLGPGDPAVRVHGEPRDLALLLWRRIGPDSGSVRVDGDRGVLGRLLALRLTP
ncbi:MAG TPA: maleylpyruvate isomerase family mycothiol-dependent enzyme [Actinotalea sp.]|nr:maleylpyruvate isomerase family mycothiol-dependent enzyme [Actinotalea sp.]